MGNGMNKKWMKIAGITMAAAILTGYSAYAAGDGENGASAKVPFSDIAKHWAKSYIEQAVVKGYVSGYENGTFQPDRGISRAEFATMLMKATGTVVDASSASPWYTPYAKAAAESGAYANGDFPANGWDKPMTRLEMARMAVRASGEKNDDPLKWMYLVTKAGIMSGYPGGELGTDKATTRAESLVVIEKTLKVKAGETLTSDKYAVSQAELLWHKTNIFTVMPEVFSKQVPGYTWDPKNLILKTADGLYSSELQQLIAIDLADPKDPNLKEIPKLSSWTWDGFPVVKYKDAYLIYFKGKVLFNKDSTKYANFGNYADFNFLPISISGPKSSDYKALSKGVLNCPIVIDDQPAVIVPKKGYLTNTTFQLELVSPAAAPTPITRKIFIRSAVPEQM